MAARRRTSSAPRRYHGERIDGTQVEMILFAGAVYFVISPPGASLLVSYLKKGRFNDYPEKCFKMVWSLSGADRLFNRSEKGGGGSLRTIGFR